MAGYMQHAKPKPNNHIRNYGLLNTLLISILHGSPIPDCSDNGG